MLSQSRWRRAQKYEQGFWESVARNAARGAYEQLDFYEWRARQLSERLRSAGAEDLLDGSARILELGSGPVGILGYLPGMEKVAVDPLNEFYGSNEQLGELRKPDVRYVAALGEEVPIASRTFDLVIIDNCIDHVHDVDAVMFEIRRLLKDNGFLYITVNGRSRLGYWVHRALARFRLDPGHPHTFTVRRFRELIERFGFRLLQFDAPPWQKAWIQDLTSRSARGRLKGVLLVSEHLLTAVARKHST